MFSYFSSLFCFFNFKLLIFQLHVSNLLQLQSGASHSVGGTILSPVFLRLLFLQRCLALVLLLPRRILRPLQAGGRLVQCAALSLIDSLAGWSVHTFPASPLSEESYAVMNVGESEADWEWCMGPLKLRTAGGEGTFRMWQEAHGGSLWSLGFIFSPSTPKWSLSCQLPQGQSKWVLGSISFGCGTFH